MDLTTFAKVADSLPGGRGDDKPDSAFNKRQLKAGMRVEREHTGKSRVTKEIAKDHLTESPRYYSELKKMEKKLADAGMSGLGAAPKPIDVPEVTQAVRPGPQPAMSGVVRIVKSKPTTVNIARTGDMGMKLAYGNMFRYAPAAAPAAATQATNTRFTVPVHPGGNVAHEQPDASGAVHPVAGQGAVGPVHPAAAAGQPMVSQGPQPQPQQKRPQVMNLKINDPSAPKPQRGGLATNQVGDGGTATMYDPSKGMMFNTGTRSHEDLAKDWTHQSVQNQLNGGGAGGGAATDGLQGNLNRSAMAATAGMNPTQANLYHLAGQGDPQAIQTLKSMGISGYKLTDTLKAMGATSPEQLQAQRHAIDSTRGYFGRRAVGVGRTLGSAAGATARGVGSFLGTTGGGLGVAAEQGASDLAGGVSSLAKGVMNRVRGQGVKANNVLSNTPAAQPAVAASNTPDTAMSGKPGDPSGAVAGERGAESAGDGGNQTTTTETKGTDQAAVPGKIEPGKTPGAPLNARDTDPRFGDAHPAGVVNAAPADGTGQEQPATPADKGYTVRYPGTQDYGNGNDVRRLRRAVEGAASPTPVPENPLNTGRN